MRELPPPLRTEKISDGASWPELVALGVIAFVLVIVVPIIAVVLG